jgi:hypothetical protein
MPRLKNFVSSVLLALGYSINSKSKKKLLGDLVRLASGVGLSAVEARKAYNTSEALALSLLRAVHQENPVDLSKHPDVAKLSFPDAMTQASVLLARIEQCVDTTKPESTKPFKKSTRSKQGKPC